MKLMTALAVGFLLLMGCLQDLPFNSGVVISKNHQPEKKWVQIVLIPYIMKVGGMSTINFNSVPMFHQRPEHWVIVIQETAEFESERRLMQRNVYVPQDTYDRLSVGDTYTAQVTDKTELFVEKRPASNEEKLAYGIQPADPDNSAEINS